MRNQWHTILHIPTNFRACGLLSDREIKIIHFLEWEPVGSHSRDRPVYRQTLCLCATTALSTIFRNSIPNTYEAIVAQWNNIYL